MSITLEKTHRGSEALPLGLYQQYGSVKGTCITPLQYHKDLELILTLEGSTTLVVDGETWETKPGVLYFINPYQIHSMHVATPPSRYDCLVIPMNLLAFPVGHATMTDLISPIFNGELSFGLQTQDPVLMELFHRITACYGQKEQNATAIMGYLLLLLDHSKKIGLLTESSLSSTVPIRKAIDYIQSNINKRISLSDMAASVGMNPKYFCSYFKKHTLTTPITYLTMLRICHAKTLLQEKQLSILEVALSCGFDNVSFFIRQFKAATGQTPGQYRKTRCR